MGAGPGVGAGEKGGEREGVESAELKERLRQPRGLSWGRQQAPRRGAAPGGGSLWLGLAILSLPPGLSKGIGQSYRRH